MSRRVVELTANDLGELADRCRRCLFWEFGAPRPIDDVPQADELTGDAVIQKTAWWRSQELETGSPGRVVRIDGNPVAWCEFGPATAFTRRRQPVPRVSDDALFLATLWVEPPHRGRGFGRLLVQAAAKEALRRDLHGVEAYGDRRHRDAACVLPCTWLLHEGFQVHREHPRYPLLRMDVRSIARWAEPLEHALEHALERLGRRPDLEPAPHTSRSNGS